MACYFTDPVRVVTLEDFPVRAYVRPVGGFIRLAEFISAVKERLSSVDGTLCVLEVVFRHGGGWLKAGVQLE